MAPGWHGPLLSSSIPGKGARPKRLAASGRTGLEVQREVLDTLLCQAGLEEAVGEVTEGNSVWHVDTSLRPPRTPKAPLIWSATLCQLSYSHGCATVAAGAAGLDYEAA